MFNKLLTIHREEDLRHFINTISKDYFDAVVVEGYDGVGKGQVLKIITEELLVEPYRPDYNLWNSHDLRPFDRWKISAAFWDVFSHFDLSHQKIFLFDRGIPSGAVYNDDFRIAMDYSKFVKSSKILYIYVRCTYEDYKKFAECRAAGRTFDLVSRATFHEMEDKYYKFWDYSGAHFIEYWNNYSEDIYEETSKTCEGCGHFSAGWCRHPVCNCRVASSNPRCSYSIDREVQDINV